MQTGGAGEGNGWPRFANVVTRVAGMETYFLRTNPEVRAFVARGGEDADADVARAFLAGDARMDEVEGAMRGYLEVVRGAQAWAELDQSAEDGGGRFVPPTAEGLVLGVPTYELGAARCLGRWICVKMRLDAREGLWDEVGVGFRRGLVVGRAVSMRGLLIARIGAQAVRLGVLSEVRGVAGDGQVPVEFWRGVIGEMEEWELPDAALAAEVERIVARDALEAIERARGGEAGEDTARRAVLPGAVVPAWVDRYYGALGRVLSEGTEAGARREAWAEVEALLGQEPIEGAPLPMARPLVGAVRMHAAWTAATRAIAGVEVFRKERGRLPVDLGELVPGVLKDVSGDVYAEGGVELGRLEVREDGYEVRVGGVAARVVVR